MDSNVIEFPTRAVRDWIAIEKTIREILNRSGASPEMSEEVCASMKEVYPKFAARFKIAYELPALPEGLTLMVQNSFNKAFKEFGEELHEYTNELLFDRLLVEIELYKLRHEDEQPKKP